MATIDVKDAAGATQTLERPLTPGQKTMALSRPIVVASDQSAVPVSGTIGVTGIPTTAPTRGPGAGDSNTTRVTVDTGQVGPLINSSVPTISGGYEFETVAVSTTAKLGATGAVGDYLEGVVCVVATAATSQVQIQDGNGTAITVLPNNVGGGVGTYYVPLGIRAIVATTPGWNVITAAGVTVIATGDFT